MAARGLENGISSLHKHRGERKNNPELKNSHIMIDRLSTAEMWKIVEAAFIRTRNISFDRQDFLITEEFQGQTVKRFYGKFKELTEICDFENKEETLLRDVFITNLIDPKFKKELLELTAEPRQALEPAINMELGIQIQHQIQQHNKTLIPASVNSIQFPASSR